MKAHFTSLFVVCLILCGSAVCASAQNLQSLYEEGRTEYYAGQLESAREKLTKVLAANPGHVQTRAMLAQIQQQLGSGDAGLRKEYEKIIIPKIEFTDIELGEALDGVRILSRKASNEKVTPNIIVRSPELAKKVVSITLTNVPLTEVLNYLAQLSDAQLVYDKSAVLIGPKPPKN